MKKVMMQIRPEGLGSNKEVDRLLGSEGSDKPSAVLQQIRGRVDECNGRYDGVRIDQVDAGAEAFYKYDMDH